jgi:hypothetical protein
MIILAQAIQLSGEQVTMGVLALILVKGLDWFKEWLADKKDERVEKAKAISEESRTEFLRRIADATSKQNTLLADLNTKIAVDKATGDERHSENQKAMAGVCKYKP